MNKSSRKIQFVRGNTTFEITCEEKENLLDAMRRQGIDCSAACGGKGTCGKCRLQVLQGELEVTIQDQKIFDREALAKGFRLSCKAYPKEECTLRLVTGDESDFEIINATNGRNDCHVHRDCVADKEYGIAVDIGTTTLAISLVGFTSKKVLYTDTTVNKQRVYGADVISRIKASNSGKRNRLKNQIRNELYECFQLLIQETGIEKETIKKIAIAGNTTMGHLFMGYSCMELGVYPFTPVNMNGIDKGFEDIFGTDYLEASVTLLPGISAFVGGDITSGLVVCDFDRSESPNLLIDLGTNGEMAIGTKDRILVTSTAAGPAFEGGNISCGVGSIAGAICSASILVDKIDKESDKSKCYNLEYKTIGDKNPVGICGTGAIELTSELVKNGMVDETGLLEEAFFDDGFQIVKADEEMTLENKINDIVFTQKDIREMQLAKAAVRAGIETLLLRYGVSYEQISTVYLAGGFGYKLNIEKAVHIGLLPKELSKKIKPVGNSSLAGAILYLTEEHTKSRLEKIVSISNEINLSNDQEFHNQYVTNMYFK